MKRSLQPFTAVLLLGIYCTTNSVAMGALGEVPSEDSPSKQSLQLDMAKMSFMIAAHFASCGQDQMNYLLVSTQGFVGARVRREIQAAVGAAAMPGTLVAVQAGPKAGSSVVVPSASIADSPPGVEVLYKEIDSLRSGYVPQECLGWKQGKKWSTWDAMASGWRERVGYTATRPYMVAWTDDQRTLRVAYCGREDFAQMKGALGKLSLDLSNLEVSPVSSTAAYLTVILGTSLVLALIAFGVRATRSRRPRQPPIKGPTGSGP